MAIRIIGSPDRFAIEFEIFSNASISQAKTRVWLCGRSIGQFGEEYLWPFLESMRGSLLNGTEDIAHIESEDLANPDALFMDLIDFERWRVRFPGIGEELYDRHTVALGADYDAYIVRRTILGDAVLFIWQWWPRNSGDLAVDNNYTPRTTQTALVKRTEVDAVCHQFLALIRTE